LHQSPTPGCSQQGFSSLDSSQGNADGTGWDGNGDRSDEEGGSNDRHDKMGGRGGGRKNQVSANHSQIIQHGTSVTLQLFPTAIPSKLRIRTFLMVSVYQYLSPVVSGFLCDIVALLVLP
jgi:hypothetical protein